MCKKNPNTYSFHIFWKCTNDCTKIRTCHFSDKDKIFISKSKKYNDDFMAKNNSYTFQEKNMTQKKIENRFSISLTWQSVLMCWAHVVCILASSGRSVSDVMSSRSCIEYLSEVSTKCCRSLSSRRNFFFMASVHTNRYFFMINSSSRSFYNITSLFNRKYVFSGFSNFYNFFF